MKDGSTHLAHKVEQAVDLETGAIVALTVQGADQGDTAAMVDTAIEAARQLEQVLPEGEGLQEIVADKGYHSTERMVDLERLQIRSYVSEPKRGRRRRRGDLEAQEAVYANRRRIQGKRGKRLLRRRGELLERPFAHMYETGGMRRIPLQGHPNILKRLLIHAGGFNLGLLLRRQLGVGTPRGLQGRLLNPLLVLLVLMGLAKRTAYRIPAFIYVKIGNGPYLSEPNRRQLSTTSLRVLAKSSQ